MALTTWPAVIRISNIIPFAGVTVAYFKRYTSPRRVADANEIAVDTAIAWRAAKSALGQFRAMGSNWLDGFTLVANYCS